MEDHEPTDVYDLDNVALLTNDIESCWGRRQALDHYKPHLLRSLTATALTRSQAPGHDEVAGDVRVLRLQ